MEVEGTRQLGEVGGTEAGPEQAEQKFSPSDTHKRRWVVAGLMLVMVLASVEQTVTATAMPTIIGDLHGLEHYSWVAAIYLLAQTVTMPLYGRLSDVLGRKRILMFSIGLFLVASMLASFAQSMGQLILFRGLQGLGAGGVMPVVLTILSDLYTLKERAKMQAVFAVIWGGAALAGPALGAALLKTDHFAPMLPAALAWMMGWRTIFWVNLPAGLAAVAMLAIKYKEERGARMRVTLRSVAAQVDLAGLGLLAAGAAAILAGVSLASGVTVGWWLAGSLVVIGVAAVVAFLKWERVAANPVLPPGLMKHRAIGPSWVVAGLVGMMVLSVETYVPLYVQGGRGWSADEAAKAVTPVMLSWSIMSIVLVPLLIRWGFRRVMIIGAAMTVLTYLGLFVAVLMSAPLWVFMTILFVLGISMSPCGMGSMLGAQDAAQAGERGVVTSGVTFFRNFGGSVGVGLFGALFNLLTARRIEAIAGDAFMPGDLLDSHKLKGIREAHGEILAKAQAEISHGLLWVFAGMVVMAMVQVVMARRIPPQQHEARVSADEVMEAMG